ncbi:MULTISPECIES: hypothetical protein [unclassified Enterococcus]|uniref:hypothetical protein n=1 Tax=unclassified Enterococcus TaxID=2608891 RepID=UPI0028FD3F01|nr:MULTISPECIES: hypothetical protein [unclassified Enterococcus]MDU0320691.1 hypothetical protein [Enterococcus sp. 2STP]MDU0335819.1 hypothetical protein [Enterococcus sp. 2CBP]MDU0350373.1 hypothetical protein [Enterococcus sp. 3MOLP]
MLKKLLTSTMVLLSVSSAAAGVLCTTTVSADTVSSTTVATPQLREIGGSFSGELHEGMGVEPVNIGTVEYTIPPVIVLDVVDGGPESLSWSVAVLDQRSGLVSDWTEFKHGNTTLPINIDMSKVRIGDELQLQVHANSGEGFVTFYV